MREYVELNSIRFFSNWLRLFTSSRQVFIGNLCNVSTKALRAYCEAYGPLTEVSINRDKENNVIDVFIRI